MKCKKGGTCACNINSIEDIMNNTEDRLKLALVFRQGVQAIEKKYGSMLDFAATHQSMKECNDEIIRRDMILYRYVRRYMKQEKPIINYSI